ncbi:c-type cytochrome [Cryomorphaceae bacterium 1068]|nr:c-type cytochrome [Cryomorphaceae bacterium 1068]
MGKRWLLWGLICGVMLSCEKDNGDSNTPDRSEALLVIPDGFPSMEFPDDNPFTKVSYNLGKKLFFDPILSRDSSISCGSCHLPGKAFSDEFSVSLGVDDAPGTRNSPSLANVGYQPYFMREGGVPTLEMQVLVPIQEHNEFDFNILLIAERLNQNPEYVEMSLEAYDRAPDAFVITRAISNFERTLISGNAPYDRYFLQGDEAALNESEKRGMDLFFSDELACSSCHSGFNLTDYSFGNNGLYAAYADIGRKRLTGLDADEALFKVPSLRNVEVTGPYMHDGSMATLQEVILHYESGGEEHPNKSEQIQGFELTNAEREDLIAFLHSLTDTDFITNTNHTP